MLEIPLVRDTINISVAKHYPFVTLSWSQAHSATLLKYAAPKGSCGFLPAVGDDPETLVDVTSRFVELETPAPLDTEDSRC